MFLGKIFHRSIKKDLNPAINVSDYSKVTEEIQEYVFTPALVNGLYKIMNSMRIRTADHDGIWINGYYGSGKSHFVKYLNYCLDPKTRDEALDRLVEAVKEYDPLQDPNSDCDVTVAEIDSLVRWVKTSNFDTIIFNLGDKVGSNGEHSSTFVKAMWEEFNNHRGFHRFSIPLAQYLEKPLSEKGKYEAFKAAMVERGFDWDVDGVDLATTELDTVLEAAKEVAPELTTDLIRKRIKEDDHNLSVESFCDEIKKYLASKDDSFRMVFILDEISQFIGENRSLLLQLQQLVSNFRGASNGRAWIITTAQIDLSEIMDNCLIQQTSEEYGKIMGRFQVRVPIPENNTEFITQKRILDKDPAAVNDLKALYAENATALDTQFNLPAGFNKYRNEQEFISYYPFMPYQFPLIMRVFDAFLDLGYVDKEVKGNERSVLKITHKTAQDAQDEEIGKLISFDQFYGSMFEAGLKHAGNMAVRNAFEVIKNYSDQAFGIRVIKVLFMISHLKENDQKIFPATVDNIITLLMRDPQENKVKLREKVEDTLAFLRDNSVIRVQNVEGVGEIFYFLSVDETEVDQIIKGKRIDANIVSDQLNAIYTEYFGRPANRVSFNGNNLTVGWTIETRNYLTQANANLQVEIRRDYEGKTPAQFAMEVGAKNKLLVVLCDDFGRDESRLREDFFYYCRVEEYLKTPAENELRAKTNKDFKQRSSELYAKSIKPGFKKLLDKCAFFSGVNQIDPTKIGSKTGKERYDAALALHYEELYNQAKLVVGSDVPKTIDELKVKIRRPMDPNEYAIKPQTAAENAIDDKLMRLGTNAILSDIINAFTLPPYGWSDVATVYFINELVRRGIRGFSYHNDPNVSRNVIADNIMRDKSSFEIIPGQTVDPQLVSDFIDAWKKVFTTSGNFSHDCRELFDWCRNDDNSPINKINTNYRNISAELKQVGATGVAKALDDAVALMYDKWHAERDLEKFFKLVIDDKDQAVAISDKAHIAIDFCHNQKNAYKAVRDFVAANEDNFTYLSGCESEVATELAIKTDDWPISSMRIYIQTQKVLQAKINECRDALKVQITDAYTQALADLNDLKVQTQAIIVLPSVSSVVTTKTTTQSIASLKLNLAGVDDFKQDWLDKITNAPTAVGSGSGSGSPSGNGGAATGGTGGGPTQPTIRRKNVPIRSICRNAKTLKNSADIDAYVQEIKNKMLQELNGYDEIIIS